MTVTREMGAMRKMLLGALAALVVNGVAAAQTLPVPPPTSLPNVTPETRAAALELTEATGAAVLASTMLGLLRNQLVASIAQNSGKSQDDAGHIVDEVLLPAMQARVGELSAMIAEIYASNYTVDEMHQLVDFYHSPLGHRLLEVAPKIGQQSVIAGQTWGRSIAQEALNKNAEELRRRGVKL